MSPSDENCLLVYIAVSSVDSLLSAEEVLASGLSDEQDPGGESFEQLFARFAQMKGQKPRPGQRLIVVSLMYQ